MKNFLLLKKLLLLLLLSSFSFFCFAQVEREWVALHNGPGNTFDGTRSIAVDKAGNVYVTGLSAGAGTGSDFSTIKYNAAGIQQWEARYPGQGFSLAIDVQGNVYVTGSSLGDYATIKYNSAGVRQWVARYNGPGNSSDDARSIKVDSEGNVYITGQSVGAGTSFDYATIKYNRNGVEQWVARYDGPGDSDLAWALAIDDAENVYVTGGSAAAVDPIGFNIDYTTIKYNKNGKQLWLARYDGPPPANLYDVALAIAVDNSGNVYVTGRSTGGNETPCVCTPCVCEEDASDYATVKYDAKGVQKWVARYNGPGNSIDAAQSVAVDSRQDVYVTGYSAAEPEENNFDYATIRYDKNGNQIWARRYNGPTDEDDLARALALDGGGNVYVTGRSEGTGTGIDFATIKYNRAGVEQWVERYNGAGNAIAVDDKGNVYVTGSIPDLGLGADYGTIKYCQQNCSNQNKVQDITSVAAYNNQPFAHSNQLPHRFNIYNAPNPVIAQTSIYYDLPTDGQVSIEVFDILGRKITTLVNAGMKAGSYNIRYDASALSNGIYNYRITVKTKTKVWTHTKKLSVAK